MSRYRISVEWGIGVIKEKWKLLKTKVNLYSKRVVSFDKHNWFKLHCMYKIPLYPLATSMRAKP